MVGRAVAFVAIIVGARVEPGEWLLQLDGRGVALTVLIIVGVDDAVLVGMVVGKWDGDDDSVYVGAMEGTIDGATEGTIVGAMVGTGVMVGASVNE